MTTPETLAAIPEYACPCCGALHAGGGTKTNVRCSCGLTIRFQCRHELIASAALMRRFWPSGWCGKCHEVVHTFESSRRYPDVESATSYDDMIRQLNAAEKKEQP